MKSDMIISLTGTPGTGKTTVIEYIRNNSSYRHKFHIIDINRLIFDEGLYEDRDESRDTFNVDIDRIRSRVAELIGEIKDNSDSGGTDDMTDNMTDIMTDIIIEGHLSHFLNPDLIIVLRARPDILMERLKKRGYTHSKISENADAEALDAILIESVEESGNADNVFEIDTTGMDVISVAGSVLDIIGSFRRNDKEAIERFKPGKINWCDFVQIK